MKRPRRNWTAAEDAQLRNLFAAGSMPFARMGEALNRSPSSCNARAQQIGLSRGQRSKALLTEITERSPPTLPYVPGIVVTGRYQMVAP